MNITVPVEMTEKLFSYFAHFDAYKVKKCWKRPLLFSLILLVPASVCLFAPKQRGSVLLGGVLLAVAFIIPAGYFLSYELSLKKPQKAFKKPVAAYTLEFDENHIHVNYSNSKQKPDNYQWDDLFALYSRGEVLYLYVSPNKAFIVPKDKAKPGSEELTALLKEKVSWNKIHGKL